MMRMLRHACTRLRLVRTAPVPQVLSQRPRRALPKTSVSLVFSLAHFLDPVLVISGRIIVDFEEDNGQYWGMVEQSPDNNYEITLLDVPDGAETLLLEDEAISVRGRLQGGPHYSAFFT